MYHLTTRQDIDEGLPITLTRQAMYHLTTRLDIDEGLPITLTRQAMYHLTTRLDSHAAPVAPPPP